MALKVIQRIFMYLLGVGYFDERTVSRGTRFLCVRERGILNSPLVSKVLHQWHVKMR